MKVININGRMVLLLHLLVHL